MSTIAVATLLARRVVGRVVGEVPVVPDADTARGWARQELADPIYHQRPSLLDTVLDWILARFNDAQNALNGMDGRAAALILGSAVLVAALVVLFVAGPVRRATRARESSEVFVDDARTAAELRASADALATAGRWREAVLDRFRAVLRSLEERAVLAERPGWTADEATEEAASALPTRAAELRRASRLFDDICYGDVQARPEDDAWLREVDDAVRDTRPVRTAEQAPAVPRPAVPG